MSGAGLLVLALASAALGQTGPAGTADAKARASALFDEATDRLDHRDYAGALEKYQAAYAIYASPKILLNMGTVLQALERWAGAANTYERYQRDPAAESSRVAEVEAILLRLDGKVGRLRITVDDRAARVTVGEEAFDLETVSSVRVAPGTHVVAAERPGVGATSRSVTVAAGQVVDVPLTLRHAAVEGASAKLAAPVRAESSVGWGWIAAGAAIVAAGVVVDVAPGTARDTRLQALDVVPVVLYLAGAGALGVGILPLWN